MTEPWTPGPWEAKEHNNGASRPSWTIVQHMTSGPEWHTPWVATTDLPANARLIAAAPEMAELLHQWALAFETGEGDIITNERTWELLARINVPTPASPS